MEQEVCPRRLTRVRAVIDYCTIYFIAMSALGTLICADFFACVSTGMYRTKTALLDRPQLPTGSS